ncbi:MAG: DUF58 domain-containing protein [Gemmatimonadaceae bacterium]|nr:DUF58 domain-containing protein [Gemmatimonadaceae bacterium]
MRAAPVGPAGLSPELLRQVKRIELATRRLVDSRFAGEYHSVFKGQGMEFAEVREYQPGDEVRSIDWNVTARMRRLFVKRFVEERELTVLLLVDVSGSSRFGTGVLDKRTVAAQLAAALALTAVRNNDRVGLCAFGEQVTHLVPPRKGRRHALRIVRDVLAIPSQPGGTGLAEALDAASRALVHRSVVFVISDLVALGYEPALRRLAQRHDVVALTLDDPAERALPDLGVVHLQDPETTQRVTIDTGDRRVRAAYDAAAARERATRQTLLRRVAVDEVAVPLEHDWAEPLVRFFRMRQRRKRLG